MWTVRARHARRPAASFRLHIAGRHNVRNALAATACALAAGVPLAAIAAGPGGLRAGQGPLARARRVELAGRTLTLVDDTYNANPDSVRAAIDVLAELPGPRLLVLGDMGEVGDQGPQFHAEVGAVRPRSAASSSCSRWASSRAAMGGEHFDDIDALNAAVLAQLPQRRQRAGQGLALHEDGAGGRGDHGPRRTTTKESRRMLLSLAAWLQTLGPEFGFLRVFQYITFRAVMAAHDRAADRPGGRPVGDPPPDRAEDRPAGARLRHGDAPDQERHAHHGRRADADLDRRRHAAVVRPVEPLRLDRAGGHAGLRRRSAGSTTGARWCNKDPEGMRSREKYFWQSRDRPDRRAVPGVQHFREHQLARARAVLRVGALGLRRQPAAQGRPAGALLQGSELPAGRVRLRDPDLPGDRRRRATR